MKECFRCNVTKPLSEFYKHGMMRDGHLNKCKECTKDDATRPDDEDDAREWDRIETALEALTPPSAKGE